jgi:hypothetical protein
VLLRFELHNLGLLGRYSTTWVTSSQPEIILPLTHQMYIYVKFFPCTQIYIYINFKWNYYNLILMRIGMWKILIYVENMPSRIPFIFLVDYKTIYIPKMFLLIHNNIWLALLSKETIKNRYPKFLHVEI